MVWEVGVGGGMAGGWRWCGEGGSTWELNGVCVLMWRGESVEVVGGVRVVGEVNGRWAVGDGRRQGAGG